jgi:alpha-L-rhamnosidase
MKPTITLRRRVLPAFLVLCQLGTAKVTLGTGPAENGASRLMQPAGRGGAGLVPTALRCEYLVNPIGLDETRPRLSWRLESGQRAQVQTAWQVLVASSRELLARETGDRWDSGRTPGSQSEQVAYAGKALASRQECFWKVRVWDREGRPSRWSEPASWTLGLLQSEDWQAQWISARDSSPLPGKPQPLHLPPARHYRKEFTPAQPVRRATLYATALGIYEFELNGRRVGDAYFMPGWTDYRQRVYYQSYDVTALLERGVNAVGAIVADGWYAGYVGYGLLVGYGPNKIGRTIYGKTPALLAQLELEFKDGSRAIVGTDTSWKVTDAGPIREADLLMGESHDARQELPGWSQAGFDDRQWLAAIRAEDNGSTKATFHDGAGKRELEFGFVRPPRLQAYPAQPVRRIEEIKPLAITSPSNGVYIFNLGQNFAGVVRLKVKGPAGAKIRLRYGEMLHPDGRLMTENLRQARATDYYVLRGDLRGEVWVPRFTFHGFQFVELTGFPGRPGLEAVTGLVMHSDTPLVSEFECSDPMVNRLFKNIVWTQRANFLELPTDCPQRDEREGWMGDAQLYVRTASYNAEVAAFFTKWLREVEEAQLPGGPYPDYCPWPFQHGKAFATAWTDAGIICPWTIWKVYGDTRIIERHYASMTRFMDWRKSAAKDFLGVEHPEGNKWGDWLNQNETTPLDYIDTVYFAYTAKLMADLARAMGRESDAEGYRQLARNIQAAFARKYLKPDGTLSVDTQTAYALALSVDLIPAELRLQAGARLAQKIAGGGFRMATGFLGTRPLLPALSGAGQHDLAVRLLQSRKFPSWGFEVENGATTIWERWDSYTREDGFGKHNAAMNSYAHYSFGAVCEWMFGVLAGIDTDGEGFRRIIIRPRPPKAGSNPDQQPIDWVRARYVSPRGPIRSAWKVEADRFELAVSLPPNTCATVHVPAVAPETVTEGGKALGRAAGVKFARMENGHAVLEVGSGRYRFNSRIGR